MYSKEMQKISRGRVSGGDAFPFPKGGIHVVSFGKCGALMDTKSLNHCIKMEEMTPS